MDTMVIDTLLKLTQRSFKVDAAELQVHTPLNAIGDSLDFVDFLSDIEAAFGIDITDAHLIDVHTVGELAQMVMQLRQEQQTRTSTPAP